MSTRYNFFGGLVTDGLVLNLDAAKLQSYPGSGTNWINLINNSISGGTLYNGTSITGSGKNLAITFDGTNDYTEILDNSIIDFGTSNFTSNIWIYPSSSLIGNTEYGIINKNNGFQNSTGWGLELSTYEYSSPFPKVDIIGFNSVQSSWGLSSVLVPIKTNTWSNVNLIRTGNKFDLYVNGSLSATKINSNVGLNVDNSVNLTLGKSSTWQSYFKGNISNFNLFNKALSPFDVYQNFNALKGRYDIPDIVTSGLTLNLDAGNPYSYSPLNTGSTTWVDTTYTTTGGTLINGTSYSGGTMVFDGTDDYVQVGTSAVVNESLPFTVSFWMKLTELVNGKTAPFIFKTNSGANFILIFGENSSQYKGTVLIVPGASAAVKTDTNTSFFLNNWVNITVTYNGLGATTPSNYVIYENTVLKNQNTGVGGVADPRVNTIFGYLNSGNVMKGNVSLMQIYNRALSQAEITQNFNATRGRYGV
jgi:hypothetical protein